MFKNLHKDLPAAIVVFLVALPLCLGIALASGAPPLSGVIAGIIGGIVVGAISGSNLSVSGPAAGLTSIIIVALHDLGSFDLLLLSVFLAGAIQIGFGLIGAGALRDYIPNNVIKGMLAAIGVILILKQFPHLLGYDKDPEGDESFLQPDGENTFSEIAIASGNIATGAIILGVFSVVLLLLLDRPAIKKFKIFQFVPGALFVVLIGSLVNCLFYHYYPAFWLRDDHLVQLPEWSNAWDITQHIVPVNWSGWWKFDVWRIAATLAIVAGLETLLSLEAVDKLDPLKRPSPPNRELVAQGVGNMTSGLLGGLPITSVIVRSSANVMAGGQTKMATIAHGLLLLICLLFFSPLLNLIPKSVLAAMLILTGYKLAKPSLFIEYFKKGWDQFIPFIVTVLVIVFSDLLTGVFIGLLVGLVFIFRVNFKNNIVVTQDGNNYLVRFRNEVSYLSKPKVRQVLDNLPNDCSVLLDGTRITFIDKDVIEVVNDFIVSCKCRNIHLQIKQDKGPNDQLFLLLKH
jgi:MFS superfamily sulfate permease-like transporter